MKRKKYPEIHKDVNTSTSKNSGSIPFAAAMGDRLGSAGRPEHQGGWETVIQSATRKLFRCASPTAGGGGVPIQYT